MRNLSESAAIDAANDGVSRTDEAVSDEPMTPSIFLAEADEDRLDARRISVKGRYESGNFLNTRKRCFLGSLSDESGSMTLIIPGRIQRTMKSGVEITVFGNPSFREEWGWRLVVVFWRQGERIMKREEIPRRDVLTSRMTNLDRETLLTAKRNSGYRNVRALLTDRIRRGVRPAIAAVFPESGIVNQDFYTGLGDAVEDFVIDEITTPFTPSSLCLRLESLDGKGYDAIALLRGGGQNLSDLDDADLAETVVGMKTPVIYGSGHMSDSLFVRKVVDLDCPVPMGLGYYLKMIADNIEKL